MAYRTATKVPGLFPWLVGMALLAGGWIAVFNLGRDSLWLDESYTWFFARLPWSALLTSARIDAVNPPLYYLLVKFLVGRLDASEAVLRTPSVLFHFVGIVGAAAIGSTVAARPGGVAAAWMWALHPMTAWYAREARPYALAAGLAAVTVACFLRAERGAPRPVWIVGGVSLAAGLVSHYFFFVLAGSLVLVSMASFRQRPAFFRSWTLLSLTAMAPLAAWLAWFFAQGQPSLGIGWISTPELADIPLTLWNMLSGYGGRLDSWTTLWGSMLTAILVFSAFAAERRATFHYAVAGLAIPIAAVWIVSLRRPVFVDRYFIVLLPWLACLVAIGAQWAWRVLSSGRLGLWRWSPALAALLGLIAATQVWADPKYRREDWRGLVQAVRSSGGTVADLVLSEPEIRLPLTYYGALPSVASGTRLVPECGRHCWWVFRQPYTVTHAFTQSIRDPERAWEPDLPGECRQVSEWASPTGIGAWELRCR